ncbi:nitrous oxide reductase accessory protein NosL [soil metagenome]
MTTNRRHFLLAMAGAAAAAITAASGCKKEARCKNCGMKIDPSSPWRAELLAADGAVTTFDTPRCALQSWRSGKTPAKSLRVQDYYDRQSRDGSELRFVIGGDVVGPMGPDLVPVDPARVSKFIQDHAADRALRLDEITPEVLASIGQK